MLLCITSTVILAPTHIASCPLLSQIYIEYAVKNPCYELGESIQLDMFKDKLDAYVRKLSYFRA